MFLLRIFLIVFLGVAVRIGINFLCLPGVYGPEGAQFMVEEAKQNPEYRDLAQNYKSYIGFIIFSICIILVFAVIFFCGAAYWIGNRPYNIVFTGIVGLLIMIYVIWTIQFQKKIIEQLQLRNQERSQEEKDGSADSSPISWFRASRKIAFWIAGTWTFFLLLFAGMVFLNISPGYRIVDGDTLVIQRKAVLNKQNHESFDQFKTIKIECALEEIPKNAFDNCFELECVEIPEGTVEIGEEAFLGCIALEKILLPDGLSTIGNRAFSGCQALQEILLPDGLSKIGDGAFFGCSALKEVSLSPELMVLDRAAFHFCDSLEEVTIRGDIRDVGYSVFSNCPVHVIRIEEGTTIVNSAVFEDCVELKKVYLPASLRQFNIDRWHPLFADCSALETIFYAGSEAQWKELTKDIDGIDPGITVVTGSAG
jgi:hypothetical protein